MEPDGAAHVLVEHPEQVGRHNTRAALREYFPDHLAELNLWVMVKQEKHK